MGPLLSITAIPSAEATTPRWHYETAYDNEDGGNWQRNDNNEEANLAWGESYVMMSLASMYRTTSDPIYLDRLAWHIDGVLQQRDDARGVSDYRGVSGACWRCISYSAEPYCWTAHSGMIGFPIADFAAMVRESGMEDHHASDGETFGDKAERYITATIETVMYHEDQWNDAGYYVFREDADFWEYAGVDVPYNMNSAMGRMILALYRATGDLQWRDRAESIGTHFFNGISIGSNGEYLWNYWGGSYVVPGEDLSHAFINVAFAIELQQQGLVFDEDDLWAFSETLVSGAYIDDYTHARFIGGGETNYNSDPWITALWAPLTPWRTTVYTIGRNLFDREVEPNTLQSGWLLLGWALLAEFQPPHCTHFFYTVDWEDQGYWRQATAYSGNILTVPPDIEQGCIIPVEYEATQPVTVGQWDGSSYHPVARWQGTGFADHRFIPYEHKWPHEYWMNGILYQFEDDFIAGQGIRIREPKNITSPIIISAPPQSCTPGEPVLFTPTAYGDPPLWWSLESPPIDARVDPATGTLSWTPVDSCNASFVLRVDNDAGADTQVWTFSDPIEPEEPEDTSTPEDTSNSEDSSNPEESDTSEDEGQINDSPVGTNIDSENSGCGCSQSTGASWLWIGGIVLLGLRRGHRKVGVREVAKPRAHF